MRCIRNACRHFMTRDPFEVTPAMQASWWSSMQRRDPENKTWQPYLAWIDGLPVGYAITWHGSRIKQYRVMSNEALNAWWLTGALLEPIRGRGLGRQLFLKLIAAVGTPCWLEVNLDNPAARKLYQSLGFQVVGTDADVATMRLGRAPT
jgi:GNAT superfamily N-acetyltransferase